MRIKSNGTKGKANTQIYFVWLQNTWVLFWIDSIAVSLFGNMTVETGEILIITKVSEQKIQIIILILKRGPCLLLES